MAGYSLVNILKGSLSRGSTIRGAARYLSSSLGGRTTKLISSLIRSTTRKPTTPKLISSLTSTASTFPYQTLPRSSSPWLRLPMDMNGPQGPDYVDYDNFLNLIDKRLVKLDVSMCYSCDMTFCVGSSRGTLAYACVNGRMYPAYPYAGGAVKINCYGDSNSPPLYSSTRYFTQIGSVLTALCEPWQDLDSWTPKNYLEFFICWPNFDREWIRYPYLFHKEDPPIAYSAKTRTVYKLSRDSKHRLYIELWEVFVKHIKVKSRFYVAASSSSMETSERELRMRCHQDRYLVVTGDLGEADPGLYLVIRHHNRELGHSQTRAMDVFKFDLVGRRMTQTTNLDDHAFFIGRGSESFAIPVNTCPELKRDSIYISDDLGVFDLKERSLTPFLEMGDLSMTRPETFWVPPSPLCKEV